MVKAVGIDPGTYSMDIFGFDDETGKVIIDESIPRVKITENPGIVLEILRKVKEEHGIDVIVGPSGYGVPTKRATELTDDDIRYATFITYRDYERRLRIVGLRRLMRLLKDAPELNVWFCPGVIHLPTVPEHRKVNKIDMGTADKVFSVVAAVRDFYEEGVPLDRLDFVLVEVGFAYNAVIGVREGVIVDGVGGTYASIGYLGMGALDAELAYAIANSVDDFSKNMLFQGGAAYIAGIDPFRTSIEEFVKRAKEGDKRAKLAYEAFIEGILKDVARILVTVDSPRAIVLSGRFVRIQEFRKDLEDRLSRLLRRFRIDCEIRYIRRRGKVCKEAAEGAAVIANGIAGGIYKEIVRHMRLLEAYGHVFDHICLPEDIINKIKKTFTSVPV